ncbi:MAG: hypothetical protein WBB18_16365 [Nodosilinea sp.]
MKPNSLYAQLELIQEPLDRSSQSRYAIGQAWLAAKQRLGPAASRLFAYLCGSTDLRIKTRLVLNANPGQRGITLFLVYDPVSQQHQTFSSEQELRVWVEQRYYQ